MIRGALGHLPGIGPVRERTLRERGVGTWLDVLATGALPGIEADPLTAAVRRCEQALVERDLGYLVRTLRSPDHWRILTEYFDDAAFFDIETTGLEASSEVAVVACWFRGRLDLFVHGENLDAFLDWLEHVPLLVSFNGASFDVPRIEQAFHIPRLPCPHLDLRPVCRHAGHSGGLKEIERRLGVRRPADLETVSGEDTGWLWRAWQQDGDRRARTTLLRYCAADVLATREVAKRVLGRPPTAADAGLWTALPQGVEPEYPPPTPAAPAPAAGPLAARLQRHLARKRI